MLALRITNGLQKANDKAFASERRQRVDAQHRWWWASVFVNPRVIPPQTLSGYCRNSSHSSLLCCCIPHSPPALLPLALVEEVKSW